MLSWIIQITIISVILVFLIHHLINFFKATLTVPKIKDLVNIPNQKYENMLNIIKNSSNSYDSQKSYTDEYKIIDLLPHSEEQPTMKNELKSFLKKQLNPTSISGTDISALDLMVSMNSYSEFK
jgi:hypothetical protein